MYTLFGLLLQHKKSQRSYGQEQQLEVLLEPIASRGLYKLSNVRHIKRLKGCRSPCASANRRKIIPPTRRWCGWLSRLEGLAHDGRPHLNVKPLVALDVEDVATAGVFADDNDATAIAAENRAQHRHR